MKFRPLKADEIECRIAMVKANGVSLLLYKDARCDQNILDETLGQMNWKKSYELIDGQLFCTIYIWDETKKEWVGKQDVGVESYTEAEKGRASDAQKRAAFVWGIGRELYTAPFIWIDAKDCSIKQDAKGTYKCFDRFRVRDIAINDGKITSLAIMNESKQQLVYRFDKRMDGTTQTIDAVKVQTLEKMIEKKNQNRNSVLQFYKVERFEDMTIEDFVSAMNKLEKIRG